MCQCTRRARASRDRSCRHPAIGRQCEVWNGLCIYPAIWFVSLACAVSLDNHATGKFKVPARLATAAREAQAAVLPGNVDGEVPHYDAERGCLEPNVELYEPGGACPLLPFSNFVAGFNYCLEVVRRRRDAEVGVVDEWEQTHGPLETYLAAHPHAISSAAAGRIRAANEVLTSAQNGFRRTGPVFAEAAEAWAARGSS